MSVATQAHSPFAVGSKRLFESEENEDRLQRRDSGAASHKRYRGRGSPADRCGAGGAQGAYSISPATLAALRGLFPEMSDKVGGGRGAAVGAGRGERSARQQPHATRVHSAALAPPRLGCLLTPAPSPPLTPPPDHRGRAGRVRRQH